MAIKKGRGLLNSLGIRVLSISVLFLAVPLVVYSGVLYLVDYRQYVRNLFEELDLIAEEEVAYLNENQQNQENILELVEEFVGSFRSEKKELSHDQVNVILKKFTKQEDVSQTAHSTVNDKGEIVCQKSTLQGYQGVNFSKYFTLEQLGGKKYSSFIAKDPLFGYSMYIVNFINKDAVIMSITSLDKILDKILEFRKLPYLDIFIVSSKGEVIAASSKQYLGKIFSTKKEGENIVLEKVSYVEKGAVFTFGGKQNLAGARAVDKNSIFLMVSAPKYIVMHKFVTFLLELGIFLVVVIVIGGLTAYIFTLRMAKPMRQLNNVMSTVGSGNLEAQYIFDRYGFEINHLGDSFNQMRINLLKYIEQVQKERAMKEVFEKELQIGHQIQKALLPSELASIDGVEINAYYSAAKEVAGDFYDYLVLEENKVLITIADGVGKGISSCLYSFDLRSILKTQAIENRPLNELVIRTNHIFCSDTKDSCNFVTVLTGILDKKEKYFEFTNAGHLPVIVKRKNAGVDLFSTKGIALGIEEFKEVEVKKIPLEIGDYLILYTDGITEAQNKEKKLYTEERLKQSVESFTGENAESFTKHIIDGVSTFVEGEEQYDDITLVVFRLQ
jgi:serine phosphatase RsbU (regulator of sigma subunit)